MPVTPEFSTADLCDQHESKVVVAAAGRMQSYGGRKQFCGPVATIRCYEDNSMVREAVSEPGNGRVLVVDGGASFKCALLGDQLAVKAVGNGWNGVVVWGCVRDTAIMAGLDLGVMAMATCPRKSIKLGRGTREVPVVLGDVECRPGMYLYADSDGIILAEEELLA